MVPTPPSMYSNKYERFFENPNVLKISSIIFLFQFFFLDLHRTLKHNKNGTRLSKDAGLNRPPKQY
jgi:hypothetical protein